MPECVRACLCWGGGTFKQEAFVLLEASEGLPHEEVQTWLIGQLGCVFIGSPIPMHLAGYLTLVCVDLLLL